MKAFKVLGFKAVQQQKDSLVGASLELNYIFCMKKCIIKMKQTKLHVMKINGDREYFNFENTLIAYSI